MPIYFEADQGIDFGDVTQCLSTYLSTMKSTNLQVLHAFVHFQLFIEDTI